MNTLAERPSKLDYFCGLQAVQLINFPGVNSLWNVADSCA